MDQNSLIKVCVLSVAFGLCATFLTEEDKESTLHGVVVLYRHGDRSPCCDDTWPTDPYYWNMSLWPEGHGQLNKMGKIRQFELGKWFRSRYKDFLSPIYNRSDIYVRSTDVDRTLMSALSNLAGLYSPVKSQVWNENIRWQPIPVHTVPSNDDGILAFGGSCPKYDRLRKALLTGNQIGNILKEHQDTLDRLSKETGIKNITLDNVAGIFSSVIIYRQFQLDVPPWSYVLWHEIQKLAAINFQLNTYIPELARLRTGRFFDYLIDHLYSVKAQALNNFSYDENPKFLMLSAHDDTLSDITNAIGVFQGSVPEFASTVIWELRSINDKYFVNMLFRNSSNLVELQIFNCEFDCPLNQFSFVLTNVTLDEEDWRSNCQDQAF